MDAGAQAVQRVESHLLAQTQSHTTTCDAQRAHASLSAGGSRASVGSL